MRGNLIGGKGGIRTHDSGDRYTEFRVRRIRPLCHLSARSALRRGRILALHAHLSKPKLLKLDKSSKVEET